MHLKTIRKLFIAVSALGLASTQAVYAEDNGVGNQVEPIELLIKFDIVGTPGQTNDMPPVPYFEISGPGYATITTSSGEILDNRVPGLELAQLSGGRITLLGDPNTQPVVDFTCLPDSCNITLDDGSMLVADNRVPLDGRLVTAGVWGFVDNGNLDFNPPGVFPQRILGCGGLVGIAGPLEGTVGSICFNGVFNIPGDLGMNPNAILTGSSNCTITLHHPVIPTQMP